MKLNNLIEYDSSLELFYPESWDEDIIGLSDFNDIKEKHLIFVKNKKFLVKVLESAKQNNNSKMVGVVLSKSLIKSDSEMVQSLKSLFGMILLSDNVDLSISYLSKLFYDLIQKEATFEFDGRQVEKVRIHPTAKISQGVFLGENVEIGEGVHLYPGCIIHSNSTIGSFSEVFSGVIIYPNVHIGSHCRIHSNTVIGADGFGYNHLDGIHHKVWHLGGVRVENNVEVGACSAIDAGTFSATVIEEGCKLDNHVQVGHNCHLGKGVILCAHVAIGGSTTIGDFTVFGGKAGCSHGVEIGPGCQVGGGALINSSWPGGTSLGGHPARPVREWMRGLAYVRKESLSKDKKS